MLKGLPDGIEPTIGNLAERLGLRHHSTVELVDRLEKRGLIHRERNERHRSFVFVRISPKGESILRRVVASRRSEEHTSELQSQSNLVCRLLLEKKKNI